MKKLILLTIMIIGVNLLQAQITQAEYDQLQQSNMGNDKDKALAQVITMEKKYPNDPAVLFHRGYYHYNFEGDDNKALGYFSNAIKLNNDFVMAYLMRSKILAKKGIYAKAVDDISVAIKFNPTSADLISERASWYFSLQQYEQSLADFLQVIKLDPARSVAYYDGANTYKRLNKKTEAEQLLQSAFLQSLDNKTTMYCFYGRYLLRENRFKEASEQYRKASAISVSQWGASEYNDAGISFFRSDDIQQAVVFLEKAITAEPGNVNYILNRADVAIDVKEWQTVISLAKSALAINLKHPKANMMMAVGLTESGDVANGKLYETKAKQYEAEQNQ